MYIIDAKTNKDYFIIRYEDGKELVKINKRSNTLEDVKKFVGVFNIKKIIKEEQEK